MHEALLEQLTPSQRQAVSHREGPLLVLAGPGSGKTRVITYRIAALIESGVRPYHICAITFTNKAAEEMRQRAVALGASSGAYISTFHSLCVRILRRYAAAADIHPNFSIYDAADQSRCMKEAIKDCNLDSTNFPPARMLDAVSTLKNKLIDADAFTSRAEDFFSRTLAQVYTRYQTLLAERNGLDFDDLLMKAALLLENDASVCAELADRFQYLLIDEYQDTNHAQYRLAKALALRHGNICATGDPDQSIYRWRGADIRNILAFEKDWPQAMVVKLEENFRSTAAILRVADSLIARNANRKAKSLVAVRTDDGKVLVESYEDERAEADTVAGQVDSLLGGGVRAGSVAVFYRVNAMSRALEEAFIRHRVPYQVVRGIEFYNRKEIRDLLAYLKVLANPADEVALMRIINTPARGIGKVTIDHARNHAARHGISLSQALAQADQIAALNKGAQVKLTAFAKMLDAFRRAAAGKVAPLAERVFAESGLEESLQKGGAEGQNALENVSELINAAALYDRQAEEPSLIDWLQQISLFSDTDAYDAASERVALMTLHAAKGLEFDHVFVIGLEDGLLPHERGSASADDLEEERRLFFVGVTRAKTNLRVSYARYRTVRGQCQRTVASPFLFELGTGLTPQEHEEPEDEDDSFGAGRRPERTYRVAVPSAPSRSEPEFAPGQLVRHKIFGLGRVKKFVDMGAGSIVTVQFNTGQTKSLLLQFANLTKV
ncbi:MAG: UvrD-helicase domain-containing protein [Sedimentisphaerales bacterium]|nr:UvrD-helicase domain-containing protein [Sedimentisphaerales bacterium]